MAEITAKVKVHKTPAYEGQVRLDVTADYTDERNKEWATATPVVSATLIVREEVADRFEQGAAYTLTFTKED